MRIEIEADPDDFTVKRDLINTAFYKILERRISRRELLKTTSIVAANLAVCGRGLASSSASTALRLSFEELSHGLDEALHVANGYSHQVLLRWGDPLFENVAEFDAFKQTAISQRQQFGYNNDFVAYTPLAHAGNSSKHGLLVVNHEFVNSAMMHPGSPHAKKLSKQQVDTEMVAHGLSVIEVQLKNHAWQVNLASKYNRRITPHTKMRFFGPACGHERLKTLFAPNGEQCIGTFGNCAGGVTPWGTILTAEENVQAYFMGQANKTSEHKNYKRFGLLGDKTARSMWGKYHERWDIDKHPQASMHAGWVVEIDPYGPRFVPIKRTALGRCKHEGCDVVINKDGRVVVYMGDDQALEYIYRFVSKNKFQPGNRECNLSLLDAGELSVAEFTEQGTVVWQPLVFGRAPHIQVNGFNRQADVVLDMRYAADLIGATPMDRPEEIKVDPISGNVFAVLTNNFKRNPLGIRP